MSEMKVVNKNSKAYQAWLSYEKLSDSYLKEYNELLSNISVYGKTNLNASIKEEINRALAKFLSADFELNFNQQLQNKILIAAGKELKEIAADNEKLDSLLKSIDFAELNDEGYLIKYFKEEDLLLLTAKSDQGLLYGNFELLREIQQENDLLELDLLSNPKNNLRMLNHWDNLDGSIERGYAGKSIFYQDNHLVNDLNRIKDYARMLASIGINALSINNVNVSYQETRLIDDKIEMVITIADILRDYGITTYLSANYASPMQLSSIDTADPLDEKVRLWWKEKTAEIYDEIPDFGGFVVKADSEGRPGPFTYGRSHADGANMMAEALEPHGGLLIWRCFVYNCQQDWRDKETDRARAAYDNFKDLDGQFKENVLLQIKNGPMDFQVREPITPLFGAMPETNQVLELQVTQEYTGQQKDLCYLIPQWKKVTDFDTYAEGENTPVKRIVDGSTYNQKNTGFAAVVNVGNDQNWTGHHLAQANLYGYGRLAWNPDLSAVKITEEWIKITFGQDQEVMESLLRMLLYSWSIYEDYTSPLGIGWMVNPGHHYGVNVNGYEYSRWGTYHRADHEGIGVDRSVATGTGYAGQYFKENAEKYETIENCPDELLLFFHHVPYTHELDSGKTVIQHIYDSHFRGVAAVKELQGHWEKLEEKVDSEIFENVNKRLKMQLDNAVEWRDQVNTYFHRISGIDDQFDREIY
ncbi:alpha-glucuronidase family glycosyl hydrolase [Halanaerobium sp. ST460_2HS_T2]|uniref:alpha-glucuronidase family glycosyl hydrolase n=1 Tax=Halanaerobium sp. ST460_2HS_T2 TaxID=2183914 RepID=UPI000DF27623|nr:alpha-glucuronidase family glycosyl hydrolase [Halanaerobium sp. ST460_2HS_T2]RCW61862.1 alpha-glucuronidase [Halanaerobium sp. ST460_2HS_T2]